MPDNKPSKRSKRRDERPARKRYWFKRILETRKVRNLMRYCGLTKQSAYNRWHKERKGRVPEGYLDKCLIVEIEKEGE